MRSRRCSILALLALALVMIAGCGTHGYAAPLAKPVTLTLTAAGATQPYGTATFTPVHATRFVAYFKGQQVPSAGAKTPVVVRQGGCLGPTIAALTDGASALPGAPLTGSTVQAQPDSAGGIDIAVAPGSDLYVVVFDHPNDPVAQILACGSPLSERQQYFDLYEAARGSAGIALGTALMSPIVATRLDITLTQPAVEAEQFAVRSGSCDGAPIFTGAIAASATQAGGVLFRPLDTRDWWLSFTAGTGQPVCSKVSG